MGKTLYSDSGMADCLNTETKVLRDPLYRSNERLKGARGKAAHDLSPRQHNLQDWEEPQTSGSDAVTSLVSENPQICEMQQALLKFEGGLAFHEPPTRDRAFFSALRCLLSEILSERNPEEQDTKLRAVCKWFLRYRPRGSTMDSSTSAVLATSLSVPTPPRADKLPNQPQHSGSPAPFNLQGTKHEFNSLFSRGQGGQKDAVQPKGTLTLLREAMGPSKQGPVGTREAPSAPQRADIPLVSQPASAIKSNTPSTTQQRSRTAKKGAGYRYDDDEDENKGPAGPNFMPRDRLRGASEPAAKAEGRPGKANSWFQGPFKSGSSTAAPITAQMPRPKHRLQAEPHEASLRSKWANMAEATARSDAHVGDQLQAWSRDRAHLEGELLRREEARYGSPSWQQGFADESPQGDGYISAYQGVTVESAAAAAAGLDKSPGHPQGLQELAVPHSIAATAREVRAAAQAEYARDMQKLQDLGMPAAVQETMQKALEPVADKPYLQVLSALPKPGENLPSRPSSVPGTKAKKRPSSSKKSRRP